MSDVVDLLIVAGARPTTIEEAAAAGDVTGHRIAQTTYAGARQGAGDGRR